MSYIENNLNQDEKLESLLKPSLKPQIATTIIILSIIIFAVVNDGKEQDLIEVLVYSVLGAVIYLGYYFVLRYFSEYGISNKRVILKIGIIRRDIDEMNLNSIESVSIKQSILGRLLNYGTIIVSGRGTTQILFKDLDSPVKIRKQIQGQN